MLLLLCFVLVFLKTLQGLPGNVYVYRLAHGSVLSELTETQHCGTELYADYRSRDSETIGKLSGELNRPIVSVSASPLHHSTQPSPSNIAAAVDLPQNSSIASSGNQPERPTSAPHRSTPAATDPSTISDWRGCNRLVVSQYFELCVNTGSLCQSLREIDVTRVSNDVELFRWIRKSYNELRGWRRHRRFCLRPKSIRFVYFGLEQRRKVHILSKDDSYPPEDEIWAGRYHYTPCPVIPKGSTPMPSDAFIHYLQYCNLDVDVLPTQRIWLDRLPKKLREPLVTGSATADSNALIEAWGVQVYEGVDAAMALWTTIVAITVALGPLLCGYISITGDVQSATSIGSVILGVMAMLWMCMQIDIGRNT